MVRQVSNYFNFQSGAPCITIDIPPQGRSQSKIVEHRWTQINRKIANQAKRFIDSFKVVSDVATYLRTVRHLTDRMKVHLNCRQHLSYLIVQLTGDSAS